MLVLLGFFSQFSKILKSHPSEAMDKENEARNIDAANTVANPN